MSDMNLEIMYSDKMATISYGGKVVTLKHESDVAEQVYDYIEKTFVEQSVLIDSVKIHLLSYWKQPKIPHNIKSQKWILNCEAHSPFLHDLISAVPTNSEVLHVSVDSGGLGHFANMEPVITAEDLKLFTCDQNEMSSFKHVTNEQLLSFKSKKLNVCSASITEQGINMLLKKALSSDLTQYSLHVKFNPLTNDPVDEILKSLSHRTLDGNIVLTSPTKTATFSYIDGTVDFEI